jgi:hypothetical protein
MMSVRASSFSGSRTNNETEQEHAQIIQVNVKLFAMLCAAVTRMPSQVDPDFSSPTIQSQTPN